MVKILLFYLLVVNIISFILYGVDKSRAKNREWRISEKALLGIAAVGGSVGAIIGMTLFHHKTRHWYFLFGMPAILLLQIIFVLFLILGPIDISFF